MIYIREEVAYIRQWNVSKTGKS